MCDYLNREIEDLNIVDGEDVLMKEINAMRYGFVGFL